MFKKNLLLFSIIALLSANIFIISCSKKEEAASASNSSEDNSLQKVLDKGVFTYGNCPEYPPFSSINDEGNIEGYDVDFANYVAGKLGIKAEVKNIPWESLIVALNQGQYDAVISAITPLEAQSAGELVDFTVPYIQLNEIIITKKDNNAINSKADLADKIIGVQDSSSASIAADLLEGQGIKVKEIKKYDRNANAVADLNNGRIDAIVVGEAYAATQANNDPNMKIINDPVNSADVVIVLRKGEEELKNALNKAIEEFTNSEENKTIMKKWIPFRS